MDIYLKNKNYGHYLKLGSKIRSFNYKPLLIFDAIMTDMQSIIMDPGGLMTKVRSEQVETNEQACRSTREDNEVTMTSN